MISTFLHIIRWPNLLLVLAIQCICYQFLIDPNLTSLRMPDFLMISLVTVLLAASGYVINDYYDGTMDQINKPDRWIAGNTWSMARVLSVYRTLLLAGAVVAIILALRMDFLSYLILYPLAASGLWLYSYRLKCKPLIGNLWVALFAAGVVGIVAVPDCLNGHRPALGSGFIYYGLFAFFTTWYREMIKDLEDLEGDTAAGCKTFVVRYGMRPGKLFALLLCVIQVIGLHHWESLITGKDLTLIFTLLEGAMLASGGLVWWARETSFFSKASLLVKGVMLAGTLLLFIL